MKPLALTPALVADLQDRAARASAFKIECNRQLVAQWRKDGVPEDEIGRRLNAIDNAALHDRPIPAFSRPSSPVEGRDRSDPSNLTTTNGVQAMSSKKKATKGKAKKSKISDAEKKRRAEARLNGVSTKALKAVAAPKGDKAPKAPKTPKAPALGKRAQLEADAAAGKLPPAPDFSAETHARYRPKLTELQALVRAKDVKALKAFPIKPISTSPKALDRFRNLSVMALEAAGARASA